MSNSSPPKKKRRESGVENVLSNTQIEACLAQEDSSGSEAENVPENFIPEQSDHDSNSEESASEDEEHEKPVPVVLLN